MTGTAEIPPNASILLVDDQQANLLALRAILEEMGHRLIEARSGQEALRLLVDEDVAAVLLDVQMPDMDGFEIAKQIRSQSKSRHTPIIFLTAYDTDRPTIERAVDFLIKPLMPVVLRARVAGFVELYLKTEQIKRQSEKLRLANRNECDRAISEQRQWFRVALSSFGDAVITTDAGGRVVTLNPVAEHLTGWAQAEGKGQPLAYDALMKLLAGLSDA